jgi:hypothetical protein
MHAVMCRSRFVPRRSSAAIGSRSGHRNLYPTWRRDVATAATSAHEPTTRTTGLFFFFDPIDAVAVGTWWRDHGAGLKRSSACIRVERIGADSLLLVQRETFRNNTIVSFRHVEPQCPPRIILERCSRWASMISETDESDTARGVVAGRSDRIVLFAGRGFAVGSGVLFGFFNMDTRPAKYNS